MPPERPRRGLGATLRWVALAVAAVAVFTAAGLGILASLFASGNPEFSHRIMAILNDAIGTDSTRIVCDRVHGTLFEGAALERPRLLVRTPQGEVVWASAKRVVIDYDLLGILLSNRRSFQVTLDEPVVSLVHDAQGSIVFPRFASREGRGRAGGETSVRITARHGLFSLDWQGVRFKNVQGSARVIVTPGETSLLLEQLSGVPDSLAGAAGPVRTQGMMTVSGSTLRVDPVEIGYGSSRVTAHFDWDLSRGRVVDGSMTLAPLRVGDALRFAGNTKLDGTLRGDVSFEGLPTDGKASACLAGEIGGERIDTVRVDASFTPRSIDVLSLRVLVRGAEVTGSGSAETRGRVLGVLHFRGVDPAHAPWLQAPSGMPPGALAGTVRFETRHGRPHPAVTADVALEPSRVGRFLIRGGALRVRTVPDGSAALDSGWVDVPGGRLTGSGTLGADRTLSASIRGALDDVAAMDSLLAPVDVVAGKARIVAILQGPLQTPAFTARADVWGGRLSNGVSCDSLVVNANGVVASDPNARVTLGARGLRVDDRPFGNAQAVAHVGKSIVVEGYRQAIGDTVLTWRGGVTFNEHGGEAVIDSMRLAAGPLGFRNLEPVRIEFGGGKVRAAPLSLDLDPGRLDVDVEWDVKQDRIDARGAIQGFDVRRIPGARPQRGRIEGEMRGQFIATGPISDPELSLWLDVLHPTWSGVEGDTLSLSLQYAPGVLTIERARWTEGRGSLHLEGTARSAMNLESWLRAVRTRDAAWASRTTLAIQGGLDSLDLSELAAVVPALKTLEGRATIAADVRGTAAAPLIRLRGASPGATYRGVQAAIRDFEADYADRKLTITRCEIVQDRSLSSIDGEIPADLSLFGERRLLDDAPIRIHANVNDLDFKIAAIVSPYIAASAGRLTATADVSGTPAKPKVAGSMRLVDGTVRVAGRDEVLEGVQVEGTFDEGQLTVTRASAREGRRGKLTGSGTWRWAEPTAAAAASPGEYAFTIKATDFTTSDRTTYLFRLNGTFTITSVRAPAGGVVPKITGAAILSSGNLTLNLAEPSEEPPPVPFQYDVNVDVPGGLFYRTVDSDVELTGTLRLKNDGTGDIALGTMTVKKGRYYFFTREIGNLSGELVFNSLDKTDPELAVDGQTTLRIGDQDRPINVSLTGRASQPVVHLWDPDPASRLSQADLWRAITFGQFTSFGTQDLATNGATTSGTSPDLSLPIKDYLFRNAERWLSSSGFIDTIDLRSGARSGGTTGSGTGTVDVGTVGVGKYVTRDLYLNYSRDFSGKAEEQISAEYRVTRHLLLRGQQIQRPPSSDLPPQEYNLDLKIRLEY
ncbi:MAG TPA: translocation/assembly module TamB domain-containing protein [Candidatus Eisenbacteria bacterium]